MWILNGLLAGLVAGIFMGIVSIIGSWAGVFRSNLVVIDGSFAVTMLKLRTNRAVIYALGISIHLVTSAIFGIVYYAIAEFLNFNPELALPIAIYVFLLWLAMLLLALPIAGQGIMGNKIGGFAWLEQLVLHIVFGISFWWMLAAIL